MVVLASLAWAIPAGSASEPIRVTMLGDSVADSLQYMPSAEQLLQRGYAIRFDLRVCRRLASTGCPYDGAVPSSALDAVRDDRGSLGDVLVVDVGYNDDPTLYRIGMDQVIQAAQHARGEARRLGDAPGLLADVRRDERGDPQRVEAVPAGDGRRLERLERRQAVVPLGRAAPHRCGRNRARAVPAPVPRAGGSEIRTASAATATS